MDFTSYSDLSLDDRELVEFAEEQLQRAYCPYSEFAVGAAVKTTDGSIYAASNLENAGFEVLHAEVAAISKACSEGKLDIHTLALIAKGLNSDVDTPPAPCGSCRQRIYEFAEFNNLDIRVCAVNSTKTQVLDTSISALLPYPFGPRTLGVDLSRFTPEGCQDYSLGRRRSESAIADGAQRKPQV